MASLDVGASTPLATSTTALEPHVVSTPHVVNVGTRRSLLALKQTEIVIDLLKNVWPENEYKVHAHSTTGDKNQVTALHEIGAKSLWTAELEKLLLDHEVDIIVHSLKDMPTQLPKGCTIGAITKRGDPRDALVLHPSLPAETTLSSLPPGSTIGTSSVRRSAQLERHYPHLRFESVRGNIGTRLRKLDESKPNIDSGSATRAEVSRVSSGTGVDEKDQIHYSGIILAAAGLLRMDDGNRISRYLSSKDLEDVNGPEGITSQRKGVLHAVGQGALGVEVRDADERIMELLRPINDPKTALACLTERSLLRTLEGGCSVPIGVETEWLGAKGGPSPDGANLVQSTVSTAISTGFEGNPTGNEQNERLALRAIVVSIDGTEHVETELERPIHSEAEADQLGWDAARKLVEQGADKILEKINLNRAIVEKQGDA